MAEPHIFTIDGQTFVLGLFWQPLSATTPDERAKEIRSLAKELSFDMEITRQSAMYCVGFARKSPAMKAGIFSAAAIVSKTLEVEQKVRDFIFVSPLPDGQWAYIAQRDGAILPDGDCAFSSEDAARARLLEHMSLGDWQLLIAPSIWGINDAIERDFLDMLPRKKNGKIKVHGWWRLLPVDHRRAFLVKHSRKAVLFGTVFIALAGVGGVMIYQKWKAEREARLAAEAAARTAESGQVVRPENPWKSQPLAGDMVDACLAAISDQRIFVGNWDVTSVECSNGQLAITWSPRGGGWIKHLREIKPNAVIAIDGSSASIYVPLREMKTGYDEDAPLQNDRLMQMYSAAQAYGVKFVADKKNPVSTPVLPGQETPTPRVLWREIKWTADSVLLPSAVLAALDGPGFRMNSMRSKLENGSFVWTMEGTQYVQP